MFNWIDGGSLKISFGYHLDQLSLLMGFFLFYLHIKKISYIFVIQI